MRKFKKNCILSTDHQGTTPPVAKKKSDGFEVDEKFTLSLFSDLFPQFMVSSSSFKFSSIQKPKCRTQGFKTSVHKPMCDVTALVLLSLTGANWLIEVAVVELAI